MYTHISSMDKLRDDVIDSDKKSKEGKQIKVNIINLIR